jgi:Zn-dependent protease
MLERLPLVFIQMIPFLMAIVFHEVAHAFVARRHGDRTAEDLGRLTLNPIPHIDPIGTLLFPMINMLTGIPLLFGWAKPVPINYNRLKPYRRGLFLVALAGPAANLLMGFLCAAALVALTAFVPADFYLYEPLRGMAFVGISINYALALFNLLPFPPLDGSKMVESVLSYEATRQFESLSRYSFFILLILLWTGALGYLIGGPIEYLSHASIGVWAGVFGKTGLL